MSESANSDTEDRTKEMHAQSTNFVDAVPSFPGAASNLRPASVLEQDHSDIPLVEDVMEYQYPRDCKL